MLANQENGGEKWDNEKAPSEFEELAASLRGKLKAGGPAVDPAAIHLYIAGDLNDEDCQAVRERIVTWEAWNQAYWDAVATLGDE